MIKSQNEDNQNNDEDDPIFNFGCPPATNFRIKFCYPVKLVGGRNKPVVTVCEPAVVDSVPSSPAGPPPPLSSYGQPQVLCYPSASLESKRCLDISYNVTFCI